MTKFISTSETRFQHQDASIRNLETQMGQLVKIVSERVQGTLPGNTEPNPRKQVSAVIIKDEGVAPESINESGGVENKKQKDINHPGLEVEQPKRTKLFPEPVPEYKPRIPYPSREKQ